MKERESYTSSLSANYYPTRMKALEGETIIVYDLETTGLNPDSDLWIQMSARKCVVSDGHLKEVDNRSWYAKPPFALSPKIVELTGITDDFLADKPRVRDLFEEVRDYFGHNRILGYNNNRFDDRFMSAYYKGCGSRFTVPESIDCFTFVKSVIRADETENKKLETITRYFNLEEEIKQFHNADGDTMATILVFNELLDRISEQTPVPENLIKCRVMSASDWKSPYNWKLQRVYVTTNRMKAFFDCVGKKWYLDDINDRIQRYDMEDVIMQVMRLTGCSDEKALSKWKGQVYA